MSTDAYELVDGDLHRHGARTHAHAHRGPHSHDTAEAPRTERRGSRPSEPHTHGADHDLDDHAEGAREHAHAQHDHHDHHDHGGAHGHGLIDDSIKRSRAGVRAVLISLAVLGVTAILQTLIFVLSGSVALLADLIHNFGDALTAVPLGIAFLLRSERA